MLNPKTKKWLNICYWLVIVGLAINVGRLGLARKNVSAKSAVNISSPFTYTAILRETRFDGKGNSKETLTNTWAVRSDGSRALLSGPLPGSPNPAARLVDFSDGRKVSLDDKSGKKSTTFTSSGSANWIRDAGSNCTNSSAGQPAASGDRFAGNEDVNGYRTAKFTNNQVTYWFAVDYGCAMIQFTVDWGNGEKSQQTLVALIPGEPSEKMFAVSGFQEVPPSQLLNISSPQIAEQVDRPYYKHQVRPD